jgi:predicted GIY-YIG superfamily endonuclease
MTTYLYRLWDDQDRLLYVGISKSAINRLHQHLEQQPWAQQITKQTIERCFTRDEAVYAERQAIKNEKPLHNIAHNGSSGPTPRHVTHIPNVSDESIASIERIIETIFAEQDRAQRHDDPEDYWNALLMALSFYAAGLRDACTNCWDTEPEMDHMPLRLPLARSADGICLYVCHVCGTRWRCYYAAQPATLAVAS